MTGGGPPPSGILLLDKPAGLSSNAVLQRVRRMLGAQKAGHVGSLDPLATGMLPICLGEATKIAADILSGRKRYLFTIELGSRTSTGDTEGAVVETAPVPVLETTQLRELLRRFEGPQQQIPPMYSALKRAGQPLYKLARAGIEVPRAARPIEIFELRLSSIPGSDPRSAHAPDPPPRVLELEVLCSKGTYVRTLAEDIAKAMGTCGHVGRLRRLCVEPFESAHMETLESLEEALARGETPPLIEPDVPLQHLDAVSLDAPSAAKVRHGQAVIAPDRVAAGRVRLYDAARGFMGIGESDGAGNIRPRRLFVSLNDAL